VSAVALAISVVPEALPTVVQVVLSTGGLEIGRRNTIVKDLPSVRSSVTSSRRRPRSSR
jgi:magnesium-transporting ATPase (P-type)